MAGGEEEKLREPAFTNADFPNFLTSMGFTTPVKLLNETFKKLRPVSGGKSRGKSPAIELRETSRRFKPVRAFKPTGTTPT